MYALRMTLITRVLTGIMSRVIMNQKFHYVTRDNFLNQVVMEPTGGHGILHLLTNKDNTVSDVEV